MCEQGELLYITTYKNGEIKISKEYDSSKITAAHSKMILRVDEVRVTDTEKFKKTYKANWKLKLAEGKKHHESLMDQLDPAAKHVKPECSGDQTVLQSLAKASCRLEQKLT